MHDSGLSGSSPVKRDVGGQPGSRSARSAGDLDPEALFSPIRQINPEPLAQTLLTIQACVQSIAFKFESCCQLQDRSAVVARAIGDFAYDISRVSKAKRTEILGIPDGFDSPAISAGALSDTALAITTQARAESAFAAAKLAEETRSLLQLVIASTPWLASNEIIVNGLCYAEHFSSERSVQPIAKLFGDWCFALKVIVSQETQAALHCRAVADRQIPDSSLQTHGAVRFVAIPTELAVSALVARSLKWIGAPESLGAERRGLGCLVHDSADVSQAELALFVQISKAEFTKAIRAALTPHHRTLLAEAIESRCMALKKDHTNAIAQIADTTGIGLDAVKELRILCGATPAGTRRFENAASLLTHLRLLGATTDILTIVRSNPGLFDSTEHSSQVLSVVRETQARLSRYSALFPELFCHLPAEFVQSPKRISDYAELIASLGTLPIAEECAKRQDFVERFKDSIGRELSKTFNRMEVADIVPALLTGFFSPALHLLVGQRLNGEPAPPLALKKLAGITAPRLQRLIDARILVRTAEEIWLSLLAESPLAKVLSICREILGEKGRSLTVTEKNPEPTDRRSLLTNSVRFHGTRVKILLEVIIDQELLYKGTNHTASNLKTQAYQSAFASEARAIALQLASGALSDKKRRDQGVRKMRKQLLGGEVHKFCLALNEQIDIDATGSGSVETQAAQDKLNIKELSLCRSVDDGQNLRLILKWLRRLDPAEFPERFPERFPESADD